MDPKKEPGIEIAQLMVERARFDHREDFLSLPVSQPVGALPFVLKSEYALGSKGEHAIVRLSLTTNRDKRPLYNIDVAVIALVRPKAGAENMSLEQYAVVHSAGMLFPFVRELVADLTGRGRFGPVWLHPVNLTAASGARAPGASQAAVGGEGPARYTAKARRTKKARRRRR